ncbi:MAG: hypothetical protein PUP93_30495 [Rhizonema sp. NSF051]|nr:hypothetical protein [Rhizonema sp. NSF051]
MHEEIRRIKTSFNGDTEEETIIRRPSGSGFGEFLGAIAAISFFIGAVAVVTSAMNHQEPQAQNQSHMSQVIQEVR